MAEKKALEYTRAIPRMTDAPLPDDAGEWIEAPDRRDGLIYDYDDDLHLAVEVALTTGRPLLLRGDPGSGKSSIAAYVARNLGWRYYEHIVSGQTVAQDLLWRFDVVRRLADAQARTPGANAAPLNDVDYIEPGVLWWAFDRPAALLRGGGDARALPTYQPTEPNAGLNAARDPDRAVVLIDEIDKADPEIPNALLVPLGSLTFDVTDIGRAVSLRRTGPDGNEPHKQLLSELLVVITTNEERDLPPAFLRRCVVHKLEHPDAARMVEIASLHFRRPSREISADDKSLFTKLAARVMALRGDAKAANRRQPGTAEFLDAARACLALGIQPVDENPAWRVLESVTLLKDDPITA